MSKSRYVRKVWDTHEEYMADCARVFERAEHPELSEAVAEAVEEFDTYMAELPLNDAMTALQGLVEYQRAIQDELDIRQGHLRYED